jgi:hypothetical protein
MSITGEKLLKLGQQASFIFLTDNKPLNEVIIKMADDNNLNPEQVRRVCHAANQATMIGIYKNGNDNTQEFKVASPDEVLSSMSSYTKPTTSKSAQYLEDPKSEITNRTKVASCETERLSKLKARENRTLLEKEAMRLETQIKSADSETTAMYYKYSSSIDSLYEVVKQAVLRGFGLESLIQAANASMPGEQDTVDAIFGEIKQKLAMDPSVAAAAQSGMGAPIDTPQDAATPEEGILGQLWSGAKSLFKGGEAVSKKLISDDMQAHSKDVPIKIINGRNPYFGVLRAVADDRKTLKASDREARRIKDKLKVVLRDLGSARDQEGDWY